MYKHHAEAYECLMRHHDCSSVANYLLHTIVQRIVRSRSDDCQADSPHMSQSPLHPCTHVPGTRDTPETNTHTDWDDKNYEKKGKNSEFANDYVPTSTRGSTGNNDNANAVHSNDSYTAPFLNIVDLGCGTGRVAEMLLRHPCVRRIHAYDNAPAMLERCLVNTVTAACRAGHWDRIVLIPQSRSSGADAAQHTHCLAQRCTHASHTASHDAAIDSSASSLSTTSSHSDWSFYPLNTDTHCLSDESESRSASRSLHANSSSPCRTLELCVRPYSFAHVQYGCLRPEKKEDEDGGHHALCQLVVCAWSLSFVMREQWGEGRWYDAVDAVMAEMYRLLDNTTSDAALVVIETLGNDSVEPTRNNTLMKRLEEKFGFVRWWGRTDYHFDSVEEAVQMMRFFFGAKAAQQTQERQATSRMECTGVWTLWRPRDRCHDK